MTGSVLLLPICYKVSERNRSSIKLTYQLPKPLLFLRILGQQSRLELLCAGIDLFTIGLPAQAFEQLGGFDQRRVL